ncbi:hypothetical protein RJ639_021898 [Escallonia herrerae]|uniref:Uncharacterized protein n=1 Tax=Escallonia herrerae TaxID=1293975 RepID=A0AA89AI55_9ASTE|nr:hypothetical protein RJ639_021898 [Escallonia herrerae]
MRNLTLTLQVYCWKGLRFSARQDLDGFSRFTEYGIEGVVPSELLPPDVRSKYQAKPSDRSKRAKKEETRSSANQAEENQWDMGMGVRLRFWMDVRCDDEAFNYALLPLVAKSIHRRAKLIDLAYKFEIATPASEIDAEGSRVDLDTPIAPMDTDAPMATGTTSQGGTPTPDDHQKQSSDTDAGQVEAGGEVEAGMIDGETDADVDLVAVG